MAQSVDNEATHGQVISERTKTRHAGLHKGYGSLAKESIEGKLFELDTFALILKKQAIYYFAFVVICCLLWPILWVIAPFLAMRNKQNSKMIKMFLLFLTISIGTGIVFWAAPFLLCVIGGQQHILTLMRRHEISTLDISSCFTDQVLLLLAIVFSWIYHEVSLDLSSIKLSMLSRMKDAQWGQAVILDEEQAEHVRKAAEDAVMGEKEKSELIKQLFSPTAPARKAPEKLRHHVLHDMPIEDTEGQKATLVPLFDVMCILEERVPGWSSGQDAVRDHIAEVTGEQNLFKDMLKHAAPMAKAKGLTALDVFLTREQWLMHENITMWNAFTIVGGQAKDWMSVFPDTFRQNPSWAIGACAVAVISTLVPRLWLKFRLGGVFFPTYVGARVLVCVSGTTTFCVTLFWLLLFFTVILEYRRNVCQVTILGALVEPRLRVAYVEKFLMHGSYFAYDADQAEEVLATLPILSLKYASNVASFWQLRDYVFLDRANERMGMSVFLEILIIWLLIKFVMTVAITLVLAKLTPFLVVTLFDIAIFGALLVYTLAIALTINSLTEYQQRCLVETKQRLVLDLAEIDFNSKGKDQSPETQNMRDTRRLLAECEEIIRECDHSDRILMDMDVTPGKVLSVAGTVAGAVMTLLTQMMSDGRINHPAGLKEAFLQFVTAHQPFGYHVSHSHWSTITSHTDPMLFLHSRGH